jgi:hypothetical protein
MNMNDVRRGESMAGYVRKTVATPEEILEKAREILPRRIGLSRTRTSKDGATYTGEEGTVSLHIHPHSMYTEVVAETDQLRTSKMDYEIQRFLNHLPYEPGDRGGPGSGDPS